MLIVAVGLLLFRRSAPTRRTRTSCSASCLLVRGHRARDVADDRGDHVGGAAAAGRRRLGDERRDPRARRRARASRCSAASPRRGTRAQIAPFLRGLEPRPDRSAARRRSPARSTSRRRSPAAGVERADGGRRPRVRQRHPPRGHGRRGARALSAGIVWRYLPHSLSPKAPCADRSSAVEDAAELGVAGVPPIFADDRDDRERTA